VQIIPQTRPRYGKTISELESTWLRRLGSEAFTAVVFEESGAGSCKLMDADISCTSAMFDCIWR
jgi:hypothetical protein